jgi:hypothetical protein
MLAEMCKARGARTMIRYVETGGGAPGGVVVGGGGACW